ncbi:hypothetical protein DQ384_38005 [Sphaerisporangium album]|uniref:Uncharacterized protein n=1 Tax=Sphaerisporangium album TaxID=509200 RepID=A0A367ENU2_9ACTN|nr:hypothetical protein [Sphaerisporangium album]RCG19077.1 hypothetical protein DQ384_38005 [Sphaerisporangium album]
MSKHTPTTGQHSTPSFEAADVPALRRELLGWLGDGRGFRFHAVMSKCAGSMMGHPELDGHPGMMRAYAEMVCEQETRTLRDAELYYVTAEMTQLVRSAAAELPAFVPDAGDFPTPRGLIVFGAPLVTHRRPERGLVLVDGRLTLDYREHAYEDINVSACTWGPYDAGGQWKHGGVWMSFYRDRAEMLAKLQHDRVRDGLRADHARLVPDNEYGIKYLDEGAEKARLQEDLAAKDDPAWTSHWAKHLMATLLLMRQPLVYQRTEPIRRGLRRQLERSGLPTGDIRIVDARPRRYTTAPRDQEAGERPQSGDHGAEETGRKVRVRFPVDGFWRNQWYPSRGVHRPKWIEEHWRGPEDAPIVHPERVRVLRTHPDQQAIGDA